jgi:hypothetical protein
MPPQIDVTIEILDQILTIRFNDKSGKWLKLRLDSIQAQLVNAKIVQILKEKENE